jgi:hypothetical protein
MTGIMRAVLQPLPDRQELFIPCRRTALPCGQFGRWSYICDRHRQPILRVNSPRRQYVMDGCRFSPFEQQIARVNLALIVVGRQEASYTNFISSPGDVWAELSTMFRQFHLKRPLLNVTRFRFRKQQRGPREQRTQTST